MLARFITFAALLATVTAATAVSQASPTSQDTPTSQASGRSRTIGRKHTRKPHATGGPQTSPTPAQAGGTPETCTIGTLMCCMNIVDPNGFGLQNELGAAPVFPTHEFYGGMGVECNFVTADSVGCVTQLACCTGENGALGATTFDCIPVRGPGGSDVTSFPS